MVFQQERYGPDAPEDWERPDCSVAKADFEMVQVS